MIENSADHDRLHLRSRPRRLLMVYPEFHPTYWGMQYSMDMIKRKSLMPPLGLLTIAAMTPKEYEIRVVDLNCRPLTDVEIEWADVVLFSSMLAQRTQLFRASRRCRNAGKLVVFGGPYPTACPEECRDECDVMVLNEGEITWPLFLRDLEAGALKPVYESKEKPDLTSTPCPRFDLVNMSEYVVVPVQFSRGCPFMCEFCDIIVMFGRKPRTKTPAQVLAELDALLAAGYRGRVFIVDDNFIGNKGAVAKLLPEIKRWNEEHGYPFSYGTEASLDLAEHPELLKGMVDAGFIFTFVGVETPSAESLKETRKVQNIGAASLLDRIRTIQESGLIVYGGFIVGFDNDTEDIFDRQIEFITEASIANAMIGPILALPGTPLHERMRREGRLIDDLNNSDGWATSGYTNMLTKIPPRQLLAGFKRIVETIYEPRAYFERTLESFMRLPREKTIRGRIRYFKWLASVELKRAAEKKDKNATAKMSAFGLLRFFWKFMAMFPQDFRKEIRRFLWRVIWTCPEQLPRTLSFILMCYHCNRYTHDYLKPRLEKVFTTLPEKPAPKPEPQEVMAGAAS
jgi:radical SAM superfamily enzyme YgiQ (UPF0313 family)